MENQMKLCAFKPCSKPIELTKFWRRFCGAVCRNAYHAQERRKAVEAWRERKAK